jgi:hypothetical protein
MLLLILSHTHADDGVAAASCFKNEYNKNHSLFNIEFFISSVYSFFLFLLFGMEGVYAVLGHSPHTYINQLTITVM